MNVKHPKVLEKRVRVSLPTLDQLKLENAVMAAVAVRDKAWIEAVIAAGGTITP